MKQNKSVVNKTIIHFNQDARFFVERGLRFLQRYDYEKAMRSFRRAIEQEPKNAEYQCHLASVLAEIGNFQASNDILYDVLEKCGPQMVEVYFYMANNYANLEDYEMAEEMAIRYLQLESDGSYRDDAEELLDYIYFELDMPPRHFLAGEREDLYSKHERARHSLEEGRFLEALELLKEIVESDPSFMPAWNNLSLAYYYVGDFQQAMTTIEETLERDHGNLHALCNLAVLLSHHNQAKELVTLIQMLKKVVPYHPDHAYKLATTMGVLGQHEEAYHLYAKMLKSGRPHEACTYHYAAISAYMSGRKEQAIRWWLKVKQLDPDSGVAEYYMEMVKAEKDGQTREVIPYHYHQPQQEVSWEKAPETGVEELKNDPMIRASLLWALQHGRDEVKFAVLQTLALIGDAEAEAAVRQCYYQTDDPQLQKLALLALADMGAEMPTAKASHTAEGMAGTSVRTEAQRIETGSSTDAVDSVEAMICRSLCAEGEKELREWSVARWRSYVQKGKRSVQVQKIVAWVAALEYLYGASKDDKKQSQAKLAEKYGVSPSTVSKCVKALQPLD
ncbi:tetratricopeptide repeat protein [Brevibacillus ruminantium]|uniref:Tetratricopeptide repeat protein n=1 Tax=Brevibacillus ruminantium TaxID=2950604 RepID=A0ABY4WDK0_9BACL|nr:tetratricopeptide repeat protein [Brevibacillus ruminantium]USG65250.1 tetratricopeptide repeat protein [Brevibacillus ruminantium]